MKERLLWLKKEKDLKQKDDFKRKEREHGTQTKPECTQEEEDQKLNLKNFLKNMRMSSQFCFLFCKPKL